MIKELDPDLDLALFDEGEEQSWQATVGGQPRGPKFQNRAEAVAYLIKLASELEGS